MTNAIHADEKQSREGLLFGLDCGRAACPSLIVCERGGAGSTGSEGSAGVVPAKAVFSHQSLEAPNP